MRSRYLLACLVLSGFSGLAYELLWVRLLSLSFGSTTLSFSTVLAVFFGGLALGAWLAGKRATRIARPVRAYALIEIGTGVCGLVLYPILVGLGQVFAAIDPGAGLGGALVRLLVAAPILLIPTVLMGATLPVVCAAMIVRDDEVGRGTGLIYGFNTIGAFLGVYLTTYYLLPSLGVFHATLATAAVNFVVGIVVLVGDHFNLDTREQPTAKAETESGPDILSKDARLAMTLTFLGGFAAICFQVVWVRLFSIFLNGTIYAVGSVLIAVLIGIGLGSLFISGFLRGSHRGALWLSLLQLGTIGAVLLMTIGLTRIEYILRALDAPPTAGLTTLHMQLGVVFAVLAIPTFCSGASFPLLVEIVENSAAGASKAVGRLYASNTIGSILGSIITGFVLLPGAGSEATILIALVMTAAVAALAAVMLAHNVPKAVGGLIAVVALTGVSFYDGFDVQRMSIPLLHKMPFGAAERERSQTLKSVAYFSEGKIATVTVQDEGESRSLRLNGLGQGVYYLHPPKYVLESFLVGLIPYIHVEAPKDALIVGLGAGVTVASLLELDVGHIKVIELEPDVVEAVDRIFDGRSPARDPRVDVEINDARHYLLLGDRRDNKYDIIASMPAHPWVAASIFTQEFFELASKNLAPGGVFSTWFGAERADGAIVKSILRGFTNVFDDYVIYHVPLTGAYYLVGSNDPIKFDPTRVASLLAHPVTHGRRDVEDPMEVASWVLATGHDSPRPAGDGPVNTDDSAYAELYVSRSSTSSAIVEGFLPHEFIRPEMVPQASRHDFYVELLERLLGTPDGRIPSRSVPLKIARAHRTLAAVGDLLSPQERRYFEGRLQLVQRRRKASRQTLASVAKGAGEVAARAARFHALTFLSDSKERLDALVALPPTTDVLTKLVDIDETRALALTPTIAVDAAADPLGWLLRQAAHGTYDDRDAIEAPLVEYVSHELRRSNNIGLLRLAARVLERAGLAEDAVTCRKWLRKLERSRGRSLFNEAMAAGRRGNMRRAARKLSEASRMRPGHRQTTNLLVRTLVSIGDHQRLAQIRKQMIFRGAQPGYVDWLIGDAQQKPIAPATFATPASNAAAMAPGR